MNKLIVGCLGLALALSSCVSQKKYADLEAKQKETQEDQWGTEIPVQLNVRHVPFC